MAGVSKRKISKTSKVEKVVYTNSKLVKSLLLADKFIYDVEIYGFGKNKYYLADSSTIASKVFVKDELELLTKDNITFKKKQKLIAAPEKWLIENNYTKQSC